MLNSIFGNSSSISGIMGQSACASSSQSSDTTSSFKETLQNTESAAQATAYPSYGNPLVAVSAAGMTTYLPQLSVSSEERQAFSADMTARLKAAGIDTSQPISFEQNADGSVTAKAGTPNKDKIDAVMAANPDLTNEYNKVAACDRAGAEAQVAVSYNQDYGCASNDGARNSVWRRYQSMFDQLGAISGQMTLGNGTIQSAALNYAQGLSA